MECPRKLEPVYCVDPSAVVWAMLPRAINGITPSSLTRMMATVEGTPTYGSGQGRREWAAREYVERQTARVVKPVAVDPRTPTFECPSPENRTVLPDRRETVSPAGFR